MAKKRWVKKNDIKEFFENPTISKAQKIHSIKQQIPLTKKTFSGISTRPEDETKTPSTKKGQNPPASIAELLMGTIPTVEVTRKNKKRSNNK